jgi:hypothetical protein
MRNGFVFHCVREITVHLFHAALEFEAFFVIRLRRGRMTKKRNCFTFTQGCVRCADFTLGYHMSPLRGFGRWVEIF